MTAFTVLRFTKLKSWGAVGGADSHNARLRETTNARPKTATAKIAQGAVTVPALFSACHVVTVNILRCAVVLTT